MRNGILFTTKRKRKIDEIFQNISVIEKEIAEAKQDGAQVHTRTYGTNIIRRPTESAAIRELTDIECVSIITNKGKYITIKYPERWLRIFKRACQLYDGTTEMQTIKERYIENRNFTNNRCKYVQLEKFLSDSFILAIQNKLLAV